MLRCASGLHHDDRKENARESKANSSCASCKQVLISERNDRVHMSMRARPQG